MITHSAVNQDSELFTEPCALDVKVMVGGGTTGELTFYIEQEDSFIILSHSMMQAIMAFGIERGVPDYDKGACPDDYQDAPELVAE